MSTGVLYANNSNANNIIESSAQGTKVVSEQQLNSSPSYVDKHYYDKEIIYNYYIMQQGKNIKNVEHKKAHLVDFVDVNDSNKNIATAKINDNNISIKGFCLVKEDIFVGKQPSTAHLLCNTNIGSITVFGNLKPINEYASLLFDPATIEYKNWQYRVLKSIVTNEARTSYNIATYVNDRKLSEIALTSLSQGADEFKTSSNEYLRALEQSKTKNKTDYITVTGIGGGGTTVVPIQNQETQKPEISDYVMKAGVNLLAGAVKAGAEIFKKDLPYLYDIVGGSKIWIDLVIDKNSGEKIR